MTVDFGFLKAQQETQRAQRAKAQIAVVGTRLQSLERANNWDGIEDYLTRVQNHSEPLEAETQSLLKGYIDRLKLVRAQKEAAPQVEGMLRTLLPSGEPAAPTMATRDEPTEMRGQTIASRPTTGVEAADAFTRLMFERPELGPALDAVRPLIQERLQQTEATSRAELNRRAAQPFRIIHDPKTGASTLLNQETGEQRPITTPEEALAAVQAMARAEATGKREGQGPTLQAVGPGSAVIVQEPGGGLSRRTDLEPGPKRERLTADDWKVLADSPATPDAPFGRLPDGAPATREQRAMANAHVEKGQQRAVQVAGAQAAARTTATYDAEGRERVKNAARFYHKGTGVQAPVDLTNADVRTADSPWVELDERNAAFVSQGNQALDIIRTIRQDIARLYPSNSPAENLKNRLVLQAKADPILARLNTLIDTFAPAIARAGGDTQNIAVAERIGIRNALGAKWWQTREGAVSSLATLERIVKHGLDRALTRKPKVTDTPDGTTFPVEGKAPSPSAWRDLGGGLRVREKP